MMANGWGGKRENQTGRPKKDETRKQRQLRAYDDEWEIIQRFSHALKHGRREECERALKTIEAMKTG